MLSQELTSSDLSNYPFIKTMSDASIEKTAKLANDLKAKFSDLLSEICEFRGECTLVINNKENK